jgi:hypothetical protein
MLFAFRSEEFVAACNETPKEFVAFVLDNELNYLLRRNEMADGCPARLVWASFVETYGDEPLWGSLLAPVRGLFAGWPLP